MITSTSNQQMKNLSALMKKSRERNKQQVFVVEGPKLCFEAPADWVQNIYVSQSFWEEAGTQEKITRYCCKNSNRVIPCEVVADSVFKSVSDTLTPQGMISVVRMPDYQLSDCLKGEKPLLLVLESIQDPGNLGTMLRTGEGAGVTGIIANRTTVDLFNPKTIRSTMGSIYRVPFYVAEDFVKTIEKIKAQGISLYAAHLNGEKVYDEQDYTGGCGFMIGNEGNGLSDTIADLADSYIRIPMEGHVESLNAAISAALLTYECNRQRRNRL